jgi:pimeloyl-ACP methyl ester carboxylesterase
MVHGIGGGSSLFQYRQNAAAIAAAGYSVYALDLLGFGLSSRPALRYTQDLLVAQLESFLEEVVAKPAVLVANGLSAAYSIRLAAQRPDLVRALVLIVPTGYERLSRPQTEERIEDFERFTGLLGALVTIFLLEEGTQRFFLLDAYIDRESLTPEVLRSYDRNLRAENARWVIFSFISGNLDQDVSGYWPRLEQPTLIVWGEEAETTPIKDAQDFLRVRPETRFVSLSGAKLLPNEDRAEAFNELVLRFLQDGGD